MDTRYFLVVLKKVYVEFSKFWDFAPFLAIFGSKLPKNAHFDPKMAKKGQKLKISKIQCILFWGPLISSLCPKISLFRQFGLELLHFSWFSGNCDFVTEMLIFARIWREMPDFFQNRYFLRLFFAEVCETHRYSYKKHHLIHLNHCFLEKKAKNGSQIVKKTPKLLFRTDL